MEEEHKCGRIGKEVVGEEGEEDDEGEEEDRGGGGEGAIAKCPVRRPFQALQSN